MYIYATKLHIHMYIKEQFIDEETYNTVVWEICYSFLSNL
jgi:hypothetical protein